MSFSLPGVYLKGDYTSVPYPPRECGRGSLTCSVSSNPKIASKSDSDRYITVCFHFHIFGLAVSHIPSALACTTPSSPSTVPLTQIFRPSTLTNVARTITLPGVLTGFLYVIFRFTVNVGAFDRGWIACQMTFPIALSRIVAITPPCSRFGCAFRPVPKV